MLPTDLSVDNDGPALSDATGLSDELLAEMHADHCDGVRCDQPPSEEELEAMHQLWLAERNLRRVRMTKAEREAEDQAINDFFAGGEFENPTRAA